MNIQLRNRRSEQGGTLLVSLLICTLLAVSIGGYLSLVEQQYTLSFRSQEWNSSIAVVEAGVEEALQHLNSNTTNLNTAGWTQSGNTYTLTRTIGPGATYWASIDTTHQNYPVIESRAIAINGTYAMNSSPTLMATLGLSYPTTSTPTRAVRVKTAKSTLYRAAMVSKRWIDLAGNTVLSDSYDSSDPAKSTNGRYDPSKYAGDFGDVASNGGILDTVSLADANIFGQLHVGPDTPIDIGPNGGVGTHAWQALNNGFQEGYLRRDANFTFPDTRLPSLVGLLQPRSGTVVLANYTYNTNSVVSTTYPNPVPPGGVYTNVAYRTSTTLPTPQPAWVTTNYNWITTSKLPNPIPAGTITTNIFSQNVTTEWPPLVALVGGVTTNYHSNRKWIVSYTYNKITGYEYTYMTEYYTYPTYTYMYDKVLTTPTYTTNYYDQIVDAGETRVAYSLSGKTLINGPDATLVLPNGMNGLENVTLAHGASVTFYVGGTSAEITGNTVYNPGGFAGNFVVFCDPSVKYIKFSGNGEFTGILVAPGALLELKGSGSGFQNFCGAIMVDTIKLNGSFSFHYDEALGKGPTSGRFLVTAWDEIK